MDGKQACERMVRFLFVIIFGTLRQGLYRIALSVLELREIGLPLPSKWQD